MMEASREEVKEFKEQLGLLTTLSKMSESIHAIELILSEQRGANIPLRLGNLESRMVEVEKTQVGREAHGSRLDKVEKIQEDMKVFMYKILGALALINVVLMVAGNFVLEKIWS